MYVCMYHEHPYVLPSLVSCLDPVEQQPYVRINVSTSIARYMAVPPLLGCVVCAIVVCAVIATCALYIGLFHGGMIDSETLKLTWIF